MYLMVQTGNLESCRVSPMLISVPYSSDGSEADLEYNVTAYPKAEKNNDSNTGTLKVTKKLYLLDDDWVDIYTPEATYYVRLYLDEAATPIPRKQGSKKKHKQQGDGQTPELPPQPLVCISMHQYETWSKHTKAIGGMIGNYKKYVEGKQTK